MSVQFNPNAKPNVQNIQQNTPAQQAQPQELPASLQDLLEAAKFEAKSVDKEIMHLGEEIKGSNKKKGADELRDTTGHVRGDDKAETIAMIEAMVGSLESDKKARKKRTKLDEKMEELAELEELIDASKLSKEDQEELQDFFANMSRIKTLKAKLRQLEESEDRAEEHVKKQKEQSQKRGGGQPKPQPAPLDIEKTEDHHG